MIFEQSARAFPGAHVGLIDRIRAVEQRIMQWPLSALPLAERAGVRVVPLIQYPFKLYYRVTGDLIEVLHVRHARRDDRDLWTEGD